VLSGSGCAGADPGQHRVDCDPPPHWIRRPLPRSARAPGLPGRHAVRARRGRWLRRSHLQRRSHLIVTRLASARLRPL